MENPKVRVSPPESGKSYTSAEIATPTPQFVDSFLFFFLNNSGFREAAGPYIILDPLFGLPRTSQETSGYASSS